MIYSEFSRRQLMSMLWWQQPRYKDRDAIIADGSIRSGKTVSMTVGFVLWSMTCFDHQAFAICGKTIESLRRNVILPLRDWLPGDFTLVEKRNENRLIISTEDGRENSYHLFGGRDVRRGGAYAALLRGASLCPLFCTGLEILVQL